MHNSLQHMRPAVWACAGDSTGMEAAQQQYSGGGVSAGGVPVEPGKVPSWGRACLQSHGGWQQHICLAHLPADSGPG